MRKQIVTPGKNEGFLVFMVAAKLIQTFKLTYFIYKIHEEKISNLKITL